MSRTPFTERTDEELIAAFQEGDGRAFEPLFERHHRAIYNFLLRSVRVPSIAEDLAQDVFVRAIASLHDFKGQAKFSTWLFTIARNQAIDHARRATHRRHKSLDESSSHDDGAGASLGEKIPAWQLSVDRQAASSDLQAAIAEAVSELPEDQREVFLLREVAGLRFQEIAEVVGVSENTIKSRMRYALERLQAALASYQEYARISEVK